MKNLLLILLFSFSSLFAFEDLTADNFDKKISNKNVVIEFYASWWYACKALGKSLTKYNASKQEDVEIYKVDIEKEPLLAKRFNIRGIPVLVYIKDGKIIAQERGVISIEKIKSNVKKYLNWFHMDKYKKGFKDSNPFYSFIPAKKASLSFVFCIFEYKNFNASTSSIDEIAFRKIQVFCKISGVKRSSSFLVPDLIISTAG